MNEYVANGEESEEGHYLVIIPYKNQFIEWMTDDFSEWEFSS